MNFILRLARRSLLAAALAALLLSSSGCTHRVAIGRWYGAVRAHLPVRKVPADMSARRSGSRHAGPDQALRDIMTTQTQNAFNPATDDRQVQLLQARLRLDPQDIDARLELAARYERYRLYDGAMEQYTRALNVALAAAEPAAGGERQHGTTPAPSRAAEAAALGLGRTARAARHGDEAIPVLAAFVKKAPKTVDVWNELGLLHEEAENRAAAERAFRGAVELDPKSDRLHNNLGYNLLMQNQLAAAEAEFRRAIQLNGRSPAARNNLGITLARRGDLRGALRQFLAVADPPAAHNNLAVVLMEMGEYEKSREELVKALAARNYFAPAMENYKLVQRLLRQRAEIVTAGGTLPLPTVRLPALAQHDFVSFKERGKESAEGENRP